MKWWRIALLCVLCAIPAPAVAAGTPSMALDRLEHDFGEVQEGRHVSTRFVVSNEGDALLVLGDVRSSCGCTTAVAGSRHVPPGGHTEITVSYDAVGATPGNKSHGVIIQTNDPRQPVAQLRIEANVVR